MSIGWRAQLPHRTAKTQRSFEDRADADAAGQAMAANRAETGGRDAAAVGAIGRAAELAGGDLALEIRRDTRRGLREDALVRILRRLAVDLNHALWHLQFRIAGPQRHERGDDALAILGLQPFRRVLAHLRRVEADPELPDV